MTKQYSVDVLGDWHLAFVTASVLADVGHKVNLCKPLNLDAKTWSEFPPLPVHEPGLAEMIQKNREAQKLHFQNGVASTQKVDFIWLAVDTPINDKDEPQLEPLLVIADEISKRPHLPRALIVSSQIPLGFCAELEKRTKLPVVYIPENLRLGKGIETFFAADRTVLGCNDSAVRGEVQKLLGSFKTEFLLCNAVTAEMVKHANNAFLATSISFANELARLGEKFNVDSVTVGKALKLDKRIGPGAYVVPGLGFAGGTLPRDLRVLQQLGRREGLAMDLVNSVLQVNENTTLALAEIITQFISREKTPPVVLILGYTYKADTDTLRRSLSLDLAQSLEKQKLKIYGYDPVMNSKDLSALPDFIHHLNSLDDLKEFPGVVVVMTARPHFKTENWGAFGAKWKSKNNPLLFLDTQNLVSQEMALKAGFDFKSLWSPLQKNSGGSHVSQ